MWCESWWREREGAWSAPPDLTGVTTASGPVQLMLVGPTNLLYVFEASTNPVHWTKIAVRTNLTGSGDFSGRAATELPQRFYRAVVP